ncbi:MULTISPECIES: acyl-CoA thioesterase [unclassified Sphingopyxis]|uniref:acyl-CoA thioesterase n=1 Tax=unclassified Sphingopyxis TaxID=2614943 RepID=UPI0007373AC0|nr:MULTISPECIES: thioesterase family protein [unclassified Sphingopyxis]KTE40728.1 4-hydroxybenzoyl-CoA thioesterase [Sphingopyxis sp. HIX]KTE83943.1 4-hydroxybenzoyl-CoA thioesterase [Sphingopyxis sp. HXXIV]
MARSDFKFHITKRVRYAEIDAQAVVFNSRYLEYFDIGITEYWRAAGVYDRWPERESPEFHVARAEVDYKVPILLDEEIDICVRCSRVGRSSMTFLFELHGKGAEDLRATGLEVSVHVAEARGAPAPVPDEFVNLFEAFEQKSLRA